MIFSIFKYTPGVFLQCSKHGMYVCMYVSLRFYLFIFRERGILEGEKHLCKRETLIGCPLHTPRLGTEPTTQACALTRN